MLRTNPTDQQRWKDDNAYIADTYKVNSRLTADVGVRFTHFTAPYEANDRIASFNPSAVNPAFGNSPCNGLLYVPGKNPCAEFGFQGGADGPNRSLRPQRPSSSRPASAWPGTCSAPARPRSAAGSACSTPASA